MQIRCLLSINGAVSKLHVSTQLTICKCRYVSVRNCPQSVVCSWYRRLRTVAVTLKNKPKVLGNHCNRVIYTNKLSFGLAESVFVKRHWERISLPHRTTKIILKKRRQNFPMWTRLRALSFCQNCPGRPVRLQRICII